MLPFLGEATSGVSGGEIAGGLSAFAVVGILLRDLVNWLLRNRRQIAAVAEAAAAASTGETAAGTAAPVLRPGEAQACIEHGAELKALRESFAGFQQSIDRLTERIDNVLLAQHQAHAAGKEL